MLSDSRHLNRYTDAIKDDKGPKTKTYKNKLRELDS